MEAEAWAAVITAGVTGAGVVGSFWLTWWSTKQNREASQAAASRSEAAAALSESYTVRVVDALEAIAANIDSGLPGVPAAPVGVRWSLVHDSGDTYRLTNAGDTAATDVTVTGHPTLIGPRNVVGGPNLAPDEALTFVAVGAMQTEDRTITVTWKDPAGEDGTWRYPLPSRPPRSRS